MISPAFWPRIGGVERHVARVSKELAARGHQVTVLTSTRRRDLPARERLGAVDVVRFAPLDLPLSTRIRRAWVAWRCFRRADVVHFHDAETFEEFYWWKRFWLPRRPLFCTFHGFGRFPVPPELAARKQRLSAHVRGSICIGAFISKWYGVEPAFVSYGGVDVPDRVEPAGSSDLIFVGRLAPDTGIQVCLEALHLLRRDHGLSLSLRVLGDGPLRESLERYSAEHHLEVTFHGFVAEPMPWLAGAKASFATGYLTMLEAMAAGKPVFAVYTHDLKRDYLQMSPFAKYVTIVGSAEALAAQLQAIWPPRPDQPPLTAARRFALEHTWDRVADTYLALYARGGVIEARLDNVRPAGAGLFPLP